MQITVDTLAQKIRLVNGNNQLGAGALAEALMPFLEAALSLPVQPAAWRAMEDLGDGHWVDADPASLAKPVQPTKGPEDDLPATPTAAMTYAAACAHFGKARVDRSGGVEGISMTVDGTDYTFKTAFRRMWRAALRSRPASALPVVGEAGKLAPGCCSAISPCSHQRQDPRSICDTCRSAPIPSVQP